MGRKKSVSGPCFHCPPLTPGIPGMGNSWGNGGKTAGNSWVPKSVLSTTPTPPLALQGWNSAAWLLDFSMIPCTPPAVLHGCNWQVNLKTKRVKLLSHDLTRPTATYKLFAYLLHVSQLRQSRQILSKRQVNILHLQPSASFCQWTFHQNWLKISKSDQKRQILKK